MTLLGQYLISPYPNTYSTRSLTMLVEVLFMLYWLTHLSAQPATIHITAREKYALLIWIIFSNLSAVMAEHTVAALVRQAEWVSTMLFMFLLAHTLKNNPGLLRLIPDSITIAFLVILIFILFTWYRLPMPETHPWVTNIKPFNHIRNSSYLPVVSYTMSLSMLVNTKKLRIVSAFYFAGCALSLAFIIWSGGRAPLLAIMTVSILLVTYSRKKLQSSILVFLIVLISYSASLNYPVKDHRLAMVVARQKIPDDISLLDKMDLSSSMRITLWKDALSATTTHPVVGLGPDGYLFMPQRYIAAVQPHNFIVQFITDWGLLGGLALLYFITSVLSRNLYHFHQSHTSRRNPYITSAVAATISLLIVGLLSGPLYHAWSLLIFSVTLAVLLLHQPRHTNTFTLQSAVCRRPLILIVTTLIPAVLLQILVNYIALDRQVPHPTSLKATIVRAFPSNLLTMQIWINSWFRTHPAHALEWVRWLQHTSPDRSYYYRLEARIMQSNGHEDKAAYLLKKADYYAPITYEMIYDRFYQK